MNEWAVPIVAVLLLWPFTATDTSSAPAATDAGTVKVIDVSLHADAVRFSPPKESVLAPCVAPKPEPASVTETPAIPIEGATLSMTGRMVNGSELLSRPFTVTTTW